MLFRERDPAMPWRKTTGMFDDIGEQMFCRVAAFHIQVVSACRCEVH